MMAIERLELTHTNRSLDVFAHWRKEGFLLLNPPYQRGDVWGPVRRRNLIRSILQGIPIPSIVVNDRGKACDYASDCHYAIIDGRQRITTILAFLDSKLLVPGEWFDHEGWIAFQDLTIAQQRRFRNKNISIAEGTLPSVEQEELVFELINFGGVPQGESDNDS